MDEAAEAVVIARLHEIGANLRACRNALDQLHADPHLWEGTVIITARGQVMPYDPAAPPAEPVYLGDLSSIRGLVGESTTSADEDTA